MATRSVSSTVDEDLFNQAHAKASAALNEAAVGPAETIRQALTHFVSSPAAAPTPALAPAAAPAQAAAAVSLSSMSSAQKAAALQFLTKARQALRDALAYFAGEHAVADTATKKRLRIQIADLEADLMKMNARISALIAGELTMAPPPQESVDKIADLAAQVSTLSLQAESADQIVSAAKSVVDIWTGAVA